MNKRIEPGLLVIFRYYSAIATAYFALIISLTFRQEGSLFVPYLRWSWLNLLVFILLFLYLTWNKLREKMGAAYLPVALVIAVAAPSLSNLFDYFLPLGRTLSILILRSWVLFPILIVPLALIAWQYKFHHVILFAVLTTILDEALIIPGIHAINIETLSILGQPLVRAFAFGTIGHIVTHLLEIQRAQQRVLLQANIDLSQHTQTLEHLATSRERNRLARELHDTLAHTLSGLSVNLEALKTTIDPSHTALRDELDKSLAEIRNGLNETRRALKDMRPLALEDLGLPLAVQNLARSAANRIDLQLETRISDHIYLPPIVEQNVYRIAQEALENVVSHAKAKNLLVVLEQRYQRLTLLIQDDGTGFEMNEIDQELRFGIRGMRERAELINGEIRINSLPDTGTCLELTVEIPHG